MAGSENLTQPKGLTPTSKREVRGPSPRSDGGGCRVWSLIFMLVTPVAVSGCWLLSPDDNNPSTLHSDANHPPVVRSAAISPDPILLSGPVSVTVDAQDVDRDTVQLRYRWFANGTLIAEQSTDALDPKALKRGDRITVEVVPSDGKTEGTSLLSKAVVVANTGPIVSSVVVVLDEAQWPRAMARAEIRDPDGDPMTIAYRWYKGDVMVKEGEDNGLDVSALKTKDMLQVEVVASDGLAAPTVVRSSPYEMRNTPPKIVSTPSPMSDAGHYHYQVQAQDQENDAIVFTLEAGPSGMTIDAQSGMLRWTPQADAAGVHRVRVMAKDSRGGFATQDFELSIAAPPRT